MTDYTDLYARLRALRIMDEVGSDNPLGRDAADAIESLQRDLAARDATIADLRERVTMLESAVILPVEEKSVLGMLGGLLADLLGEDDWLEAEPYLNAALMERNALRARAEAAEKDAARYRKARLMAITDPTPWDPTNWSVVSDPCSFDEFIDAAIAAGGDDAKD